MPDTADVDLTLLAELARQNLEATRKLGRDLAHVRTHTLQTADYARRLDRRMPEMEQRMSELKDDIELLVKSELMGALTHFETRIEKSIDRLSDRVAALEARP